jgi:hypothetical protein
MAYRSNVFGWIVLIALGIVVYRAGVKRGFLVEAERRWASENDAFLDRLRTRRDT